MSNDKLPVIVPDLIRVAATEGQKLRMPARCRPIVIVVDEDGNIGWVTALPVAQTVAALHLVLQADELDPTKQTVQ